MDIMYKYISSIGLLFDIIGVILLFFYGIPKNLNPNGYIYKVKEDVNINEINTYKKYKYWSYIALIFLLIGFIFQFIGSIFN